MAKVGAKNKLTIDDTFLKEVEVLAGRGLTHTQMHHYYGVSHTCWFDYVKKNPKLEQAIKRGKAKTISYVASRLMDSIRLGNIVAIKYYLDSQASDCGYGRNSFNEDGNKPIANTTYNLNVTDPVEAAKIYQKIIKGER